MQLGSMVFSKISRNAMALERSISRQPVLISKIPFVAWRIFLDVRRTIMVFFLCITSSIVPACLGTFSVKRYTDFSSYIDKKIPPNEALWLQNGLQSQSTGKILKIVNKIRGRNRRESLYNAVDYIWKTFSYDECSNPLAFQRTAGELFRVMSLGGCSDFALVQITLFRSLGIPSKLIITANVDWLLQCRSNPLAMTEGHCFIAVFLEDKWYLMDTTYRFIYSEYDASNPSLPHGEYYCNEGLDFWDMGIGSISEVDRIFGDMAKRYNGEYESPLYPRKPI